MEFYFLITNPDILTLSTPGTLGTLGTSSTIGTLGTDFY